MLCFLGNDGFAMLKKTFLHAAVNHQKQFPWSSREGCCYLLCLSFLNFDGKKMSTAFSSLACLFQLFDVLDKGLFMDQARILTVPQDTDIPQAQLHEALEH